MCGSSLNLELASCCSWLNLCDCQCVVVEVPNGGFAVQIPRVPFGSDLFHFVENSIRFGVELAFDRDSCSLSILLVARARRA